MTQDSGRVFCPQGADSSDHVIHIECNEVCLSVDLSFENLLYCHGTILYSQELEVFHRQLKNSLQRHLKHTL